LTKFFEATTSIIACVTEMIMFSASDSEALGVVVPGVAARYGMFGGTTDSRRIGTADDRLLYPGVTMRIALLVTTASCYT
jgi:hypothetical protein